jgi:hypothetical protein
MCGIHTTKSDKPWYVNYPHNKNHEYYLVLVGSCPRIVSLDTVSTCTETQMSFGCMFGSGGIKLGGDNVVHNLIQGSM